MKKRKPKLIWVVKGIDYDCIWIRKPNKDIFDKYDVVAYKEVL
jgi:hypothetical protein